MSSNILAIIPARSGSKSVPHKNIRLLGGKPLIAYSIEAAKASKYIDRVIVSTDSEEYAAVAREYGAQTPFLRPAEYADDTALDIAVFHHALSFLRETERVVPPLVVHLRPTYPIRRAQDIDAMIEIALADDTIDSVRSIAPATEIPYKMWTMDSGGKLAPISRDIPECYNMPRQELPKAYCHNGCIDVVRSRVILDSRSMTGGNIHGYLMRGNFDIDTEEEFAFVSQYIEVTQGKKIFCFDIDGVIAHSNGTLDYAESTPNRAMIERINRLYDYGNKIVLFTARGFVTGIDWSEITRRQMSEWGLRYTELKFGKPNADFYIDDRLMSFENLAKLFELINRE